MFREEICTTEEMWKLEHKIKVLVHKRLDMKDERPV